MIKYHSDKERKWLQNRLYMTPKLTGGGGEGRGSDERRLINWEVIRSTLQSLQVRNRVEFFVEVSRISFKEWEFEICEIKSVLKNEMFFYKKFQNCETQLFGKEEVLLRSDKCPWRARWILILSCINRLPQFSVLHDTS
jgi:hypothetical protein